MSPRMKGARAKKFFEDTEDGFEAGSAWTDPVAIADTIVQGMVRLIPMGATSITAARMAGASAAKAAAAEAAAQRPLPGRPPKSSWQRPYRRPQGAPQRLAAAYGRIRQNTRSRPADRRSGSQHGP